MARPSVDVIWPTDDVFNQFYLWVISIYRQFEKEYAGEWVANSDLAYALVDAFDVDFVEQALVAKDRWESKALHQMRWMQQVLKSEELIERNTEKRGEWRLCQPTTS